MKSFIWFIFKIFGISRVLGKFGAFGFLMINNQLFASEEITNQDIILSEVHRLRSQSDINIVMEYDSPIQWNPLFSYTTSEAQIHISLFEGLLAYDPVDMTPRPGLAERWEQDDDLRYTFYLRRNARFSNGDTIDANTIAQTWFFQIRSGSPFSSLLDLIAGVESYREGKLSKEATGIKVISPYVLEFRLKHPAPEILSILCHHSLSPLPSNMLFEQDWGEFYRKLQNPIIQPSETEENNKQNHQRAQLFSNGPYQLQSVSKAGIFLEANPYYWNSKAVASKKIFIQRYYEWQDLDIAGALDSYKIDWIASGFSSFNKLQRGQELFHVSKSFSTTFFYFAGIDNPSNSWSDSRVRKALTLLLPLQKLRSGVGGDAYLIPRMPNFKSGKSLEQQNKEEAMRLFEEAGYQDGLGTLILRFPEGLPYENFAELIKESWSSELKNEVKIQYGDPTRNFQDGSKKEQSDFTLGLLGWVGDYPDPTTFLNLWYSGSSLNMFGYNDPVYDQMLNEAQQISDRQKRFELLAKAEEYLLQNGTVIPLWHNPSFNIYDKRFLDGFYQNVLDLHPLHPLKRIYRLPKGSA